MTDYRGLILEYTREGAADRAIAQLEASLGARLQDDYCQFLKTCNGAHEEYDVLATLANGDEELLSFSLYGKRPRRAAMDNSSRPEAVIEPSGISFAFLLTLSNPPSRTNP
ncbi:SMI1/KNR4 family protein [Pseudomonas kilonensis]|uniref:SMI1/KNR4 family protein n=1 Tax=Pseudomonas kilonensis TaxID=132476 RepID=UPI0003F8EAA6|nr:SMI1/KNR4 family protein [Pseudomonas kilonensis]